MKDVEIHFVGVVRLEGDTVSVQLLLEFFSTKLVPFVSRWAILFILFESLLIEPLTLLLSRVCQDSLVCLNAEFVRVGPVLLVLDEPIVLLVCLALRLHFQLVDQLLKVLLTASSCESHRILLHTQLL